jgi:hypothetical protein
MSFENIINIHPKPKAKCYEKENKYASQTNGFQPV